MSLSGVEEVVYYKYEEENNPRHLEGYRLNQVTRLNWAMRGKRERSGGEGVSSKRK